MGRLEPPLRAALHVAVPDATQEVVRYTYGPTGTPLLTGSTQ